MILKCMATTKVIFPGITEAREFIFNLKWRYKIQKDINGKRIKHRQGRPEQRWAYYYACCDGVHITRWKPSEFNNYLSYLNTIIPDVALRQQYGG
jgi:hypothetical protein